MEGQKHVLMADQSIHHWKVVEAYIRGLLLMGSDEEDKQCKAAEKVVEQEVLWEKQRTNPLPVKAKNDDAPASVHADDTPMALHAST